MTAPKDLLSSDPPPRPEYRDGQTLRAGGLRADDAVRTRAGRLHQALAHAPGVVAGLWVSVTGVSAKVSPGMAVDGSGRTVLVGRVLAGALPDQSAEYEVWLAGVETPGDADADETPQGPPGRYTEEARLLFHRPGRYDPARPGDHPDGAVFLATVLCPASEYPKDETGKSAPPPAAVGTGRAAPPPTLADPAGVLHEGRVYTRAVGGRVEAPSKGTRLLLGPEGESDPRLFALSTRPDPRAAYTDHLTLDSAGTFQVLTPCAVGRRPQDGPAPAVVQAGVRRFGFSPADLTDPPALARRLLHGDGPVDTLLRDALLRVRPDSKAPNTDALLLAAGGSSCPDGPRAASALCRVLNRGMTLKSGSDGDGTDLSRLARDSGLRLRPEATRLLLEEVAGSSHADPERLARLILEDVYAGLLARLPEPELREGPLGLSFTGARPEPAAAMPWRVYLAAVVEKKRTRRELRVELSDPGKDNNPERSKAVVGSVGPCPGGARACFRPALTVDAGGTVTVRGNLNVFAGEPRPGATDAGLILRVRPKDPDPNAPGQAAGPGAAGQVAPWDLVLRDVHAVRDDAVIEIHGRLENTGQAPIVAVQVLAVAYAVSKPDVEPVRVTIARGLEVRPGSPVDLVDPGPPPAAVRVELPAELKGVQVTLTLKAIGFAPPNVLTDVERRVLIP